MSLCATGLTNNARLVSDAFDSSQTNVVVNLDFQFVLFLIRRECSLPRLDRHLVT